MPSFEVSVQVNGGIQEEAEITFRTSPKLNYFVIEFQNRTALLLYIKNIEFLEDQPAGILKIKYNLLAGIDFYNIRFRTEHEQQQFVEIIFPDRLQDSGRSSMESTSSSNTP
ncbi:hypothetical protein QE152_g38578 [Popillia japonica]|uniref:Uncharacterized protein n=1 Tax=Popillia japonica TaxID=7064 RepID=A0AAW1HWN5_POPJA